MNSYEYECKRCKKRFTAVIEDTNAPGCKEKEEVWCPYCGELNGFHTTNGFVRTYKVDE